MGLRTASLALTGARKRLSDVYGGGASSVNPATDIPYRQIRITPDATANVAIGDATVTAASGIVVAGPGAAILADSPTGYWPLDETSGSTAFDRAASPHNGTYSAGVTLGQPGPFGMRAATFDGASGAVTVAHDATSQSPHTGSYSIECWVKRTGNPAASEWLVVKFDGSITGLTNGGVELFLTSTGGFDSRIGNGSTQLLVASATGLADGNWHHVVIVMNRTTNFGQFYVDGVTSGAAVDISSAAANDLNVVGTFYIGRRNTAGGFFTGSLAGVALYLTALTPTQVAAHYAARTLAAQAAAGAPANITLGPVVGGLRLSDLYAIGTGTIRIAGVPY